MDFSVGRRGDYLCLYRFNPIWTDTWLDKIQDVLFVKSIHVKLYVPLLKGREAAANSLHHRQKK